MERKHYAGRSKSRNFYQCQQRMISNAIKMLFVISAINMSSP
jgi:hypothetical protein